MAKIITCTAELDNNALVENLRQCIEIVGGEPIVTRNIVKATAPYPSDLATSLIILYEEYWRHEIKISKI